MKKESKMSSYATGKKRILREKSFNNCCTLIKGEEIKKDLSPFLTFRFYLLRIGSENSLKRRERVSACARVTERDSLRVCVCISE